MPFFLMARAFYSRSGVSLQRVLTGSIYCVASLWTGHFRKDLLPASADRSWRAFWEVISNHIHRNPPDPAEAYAYNLVQRSAYIAVLFVLTPLII